MEIEQELALRSGRPSRPLVSQGQLLFHCEHAGSWLQVVHPVLQLIQEVIGPNQEQ